MNDDIKYHEDGSGPAILIVHPGLDDGTSWRKVAAHLKDRHHVVRLVRRRYRLDLPARPMASIADEAADVVALAKTLAAPVILVGHSSGGVVALEALLAAPGLFASAVIYEAPVVTGPPLGGEAGDRARKAVADGKPGRAIRIFVRDVVKVPPLVAALAGFFVALNPRMRALVPRQIDDLTAIDDLGNRLTAYAAITTPVVLLGGDRSPAHLAERLDALAAVIPHAERKVMPGQGHSAHASAPALVASLIAPPLPD